MHKIKLTLLLLFGATSGLLACPYRIINDSKEPLIVIDPNSEKAFYIEPSKAAMIDISIRGRFIKHIRKEKLAFYVAGKQPGTFLKRFLLTEGYCSEGVTTLKLSDVERLVIYPTRQRSVKSLTLEK